VLWRARFFREGIIVCAVVAALEMAARAGGNGPNMFGFTDATGIFRTFNAHGAIDFDNEFFQSLGTNGRILQLVPSARGWLDDRSIARPGTLRGDARRGPHILHQRWIELTDG
jgi:hypothetical protein